MPNQYFTLKKAKNTDFLQIQDSKLLSGVLPPKKQKIALIYQRIQSVVL
jgi:hypothetical protein